MALKESLYDHHPVSMVEGLALGTEQEYGGVLVLAPLNLSAPIGDAPAGIFEGENLSSTGWQLYSLIQEGFEAPPGTAAVLLSVACRDADGAATDAFMSFATPGIIYGSKTQIVYAGDVIDRYQSRLVLVELDDLYRMAVKLDCSALGLDFAIKLIGWLVDPTITKPSPPSKDMFAYFVVTP